MINSRWSPEIKFGRINCTLFDNFIDLKNFNHQEENYLNIPQGRQISQWLFAPQDVITIIICYHTVKICSAKHYDCKHAIGIEYIQTSYTYTRCQMDQ